MFVLAMFAFPACLFFVPRVVLHPMISAMRLQPIPKFQAGFHLIDLLTLTFLVQLPLALVRFSGARMSELPMIAYAMQFLIGFLLWRMGVRAANHIGITNPLKRFVVAVFKIPIGLLGGFAVWGLLIAVFTSSPVNFASSMPARYAVLCILVLMLVSLSAAWVQSDNALYSFNSEECKK